MLLISNPVSYSFQINENRYFFFCYSIFKSTQTKSMKTVCLTPSNWVPTGWSIYLHVSPDLICVLWSFPECLVELFAQDSTCLLFSISKHSTYSLLNCYTAPLRRHFLSFFCFRFFIHPHELFRLCRQWWTCEAHIRDSDVSWNSAFVASLSALSQMSPSCCHSISAGGGVPCRSWGSFLSVSVCTQKVEKPA